MGWATGLNGAGFRTQRHWSQDSNVMGPRAQQDELQDPMKRAPGHNGAGPSAQWGGPQQDQMGEVGENICHLKSGRTSTRGVCIQMWDEFLHFS